MFLKIFFLLFCFLAAFKTLPNYQNFVRIPPQTIWTKYVLVTFDNRTQAQSYQKIMVKVGSFFRGKRYLGNLLTFPLSFLGEKSVHDTPYLRLSPFIYGGYYIATISSPDPYISVCLSVCLSWAVRKEYQSSLCRPCSNSNIEAGARYVRKKKNLVLAPRIFLFSPGLQIVAAGNCPLNTKKTFNPFHFFPK